VEDHVARATRLGPSVLINGTWYKLDPGDLRKGRGASVAASSAYRTGNGIGPDRSAGGSLIARKRSGGDRQSNGADGIGETHGVNMLCPAAFWISNMMPGRAMARH
jgi:hypothetical protein